MADVPPSYDFVVAHEAVLQTQQYPSPESVVESNPNPLTIINMPQTFPVAQNTSSNESIEHQTTTK